MVLFVRSSLVVVLPTASHLVVLVPAAQRGPHPGEAKWTLPQETQSPLPFFPKFCHLVILRPVLRSALHCL